jgi:Asp-tRNA(Asn)/Glu-tRNA(Gln) amidotransferase A subunit family amidase
VTHPQDLSLVEQAAAVRAGTIHPAELLDATLARIRERDPQLNSTPVTFPDQSAKMLAEAGDGPLRGVPITIKDMYALPWRGAQNATGVELIAAAASGGFRRLRDAGAVVVGVANQHMAGMGTTGAVSAYGMHRNPWNSDRCPGGSSGGSAAAVAARIVAGSLGSDSGGSTRLPAAWCGVVGLKVTYRSLPYDSYFGRGTTFSAPGVFGRDAADARLLAAALLDRPLAPLDVAGVRVGLISTPFWSDCDPAVVAHCEAALDAVGWARREIAVEHLDLASAAATVRFMAEAPAPSPDLLAAAPPMSRAMAVAASFLPVAAIPRADRVRAAIRRGFALAFADVDVIAWPTTPAVAPPLDNPTVHLPSGPTPADLANMRQAMVGNLLGVPGVSVPVGFVDGLPVGLQLLGPWGHEALLLDAAERIEQATGRVHVDSIPEVAR